MGALAAFLAQSAPPGPDALDPMFAAAPHRGEKTDVVVHGRCVLGTSDRTDIADASLFVDRDLAAAFVGTLDNSAKLIAETRGLHLEATASPAALAIAALRAYGEDFPSQIRGAFSGVITDGERLWCFRDHLGLSPLFYRDDSHGIWVASEGKQIIAAAGIGREPDLETLERIFYGHFDEDMPFSLKGVQRLRKASVLIANGRGIERRVYWHPERVLETARMSAEEIQERFDELMTQAVVRGFSGKDAVSLSGGVDSPVVAAYGASEHLRIFERPLAGLSLVYPDTPSVDESVYIRSVAEELGMPLHTYRPQAKHLDGLADWMKLIEGPVPFTSIAESSEQYSRARALGFHTILTGEWAEWVVDAREHLLPHLFIHGRASALRAELRAQRRRGLRWSSVGRQLGSAFVPGPLAVKYLRQKRLKFPTWVDPSRMAAFVSAAQPPRNRWLHEQLQALSGSPGLGVEAMEICQTVNGVRVRRPWGDVDLWEFFLSLPAEVKMPPPRRKELIRRLARTRTPHVVLDRRDKTVFNDAFDKAVDYPALLKWLQVTDYRMPGVDYPSLLEGIKRRELGWFDLRWATELAILHAFLETC